MHKSQKRQAFNRLDSTINWKWLHIFNIFFFFFTEALDGLPFGTERTGGCPSYRAELKAKDNMSRMNALYPQTKL